MNDKNTQKEGVEIDPRILSLAEDLYQSQKRWEDREFVSAFEVKLKVEKIESTELRDKLTIYYAWCAQHGTIAESLNYLMLLKRILDHKQSVPGHHDIRIHEEDEP